MTAEADIRALLACHGRAIHDRDAAAVVACYADDFVSCDLAPPLIVLPPASRETAGLDAWFGTWRGPIRSVAETLTIGVDGAIGYAFGLCHMSGTKTDGETVDLWFRTTASVSKGPDGWRIAHLHNSVPFAMDGSGRALLDLKP